ncbi:MAG: hypothetical protein EBR94_11305 [Bacteroidetes bacterium]|nr:hypothetical protein [Bacteroidota bacterium]
MYVQFPLGLILIAENCRIVGGGLGQLQDGVAGTPVSASTVNIIGLQPGILYRTETGVPE